MPDPVPADLARALADAEARLDPFTRIEYYAEIDSTNTLAQKRAAAGRAHGLVILADTQTAGRGRQGRTWFSPPGAGLYMSAVLNPTVFAGTLSLLTLAAGVAAARGIERATGLALELKWPNDVVIGRPWRKIAGILCESVSSGSRVEAVIVGIGVNIRRSAFPATIAHRATALELETDRHIDAASVAVEILAALAEECAGEGPDRSTAIVDAWRKYGRAGLAGAAIHWNDEAGLHHGVARDIADDGALVVQHDGRLDRLIAGDVQWERLARD